MDRAMMSLWKLLFRPDRISEVAKPLDDIETLRSAKFAKARREFDEAFMEFQRERERWRRR